MGSYKFVQNSFESPLLEVHFLVHKHYFVFLLFVDLMDAIFSEVDFFLQIQRKCSYLKTGQTFSWPSIDEEKFINCLFFGTKQVPILFEVNCLPTQNHIPPGEWNLICAGWTVVEKLSKEQMKVDLEGTIVVVLYLI